LRGKLTELKSQPEKKQNTEHRHRTSNIEGDWFHRSRGCAGKTTLIDELVLRFLQRDSKTRIAVFGRTIQA